MLSLEFLCIIICVCYLLWHFSTSTFDHWKKQKIPFKKPVPMFGNTAHWALGRQNFYDVLEEMYYHFHDVPFFGFFRMRKPLLVIRDPEIAHNILTKDFNHFIHHGLDSFFPNKQFNPLSCHVLSASGDHWRELRRRISPMLTSSKLRPMQDYLFHVLSNFEKFLEDRMENGNTDQELKDICQKLVIDVMGICVLGIDCRSLKNNDEFLYYVNYAVNASLHKTLIGLLSKKYLLKFDIRDLPKISADYFTQLLLDLIHRRRENGATGNDFLQQLIDERTSYFDPKFAVTRTASTENGTASARLPFTKIVAIMKSVLPLIPRSLFPPAESFDEIDAIGNAFVFLMAGAETTHATLGFCLYELALNREIQETLRAEVDEVYQRDNRAPTADSMKEMKYLNAVVSETLRKYPPNSNLIRVCNEDYPVPNSSGIVIKADTHLIIPHRVYQLDEKYFPNPNMFDPMRFLGAGKANIPNGVFLPFSEGPRNCIGQQFAKMVMRIMVAHIVFKYELSPCFKTEIPLTFRKKEFLLLPKHGIWINFKQRDTKCE